MDELEFEKALETFLVNAGVEIDGGTEEKMGVVLANGELVLEFARYLFRALKVVEDKLKNAERRIGVIAGFLDRHLRSPWQ